MRHGSRRWLLAGAAFLWPAVAFAQPPSEIPDPRYTPGVVAEDGHDEATVCGLVHGLTYSKRHRATPAGLKTLIRKRYHARPGDGEVDHRCPLALGCQDSAYNLWWQPGRNQGVRFTYHEKDKLETWAWHQVCHAHTMSLADAQAIFLADDWRPLFCRYVGGTPC